MTQHDTTQRDTSQHATFPLQVVCMEMEQMGFNVTWMNALINFDNVGNAYLALFQGEARSGGTMSKNDVTISN
jgi:hypothetical protein